jgi:hypothetical protein
MTGFTLIGPSPDAFRPRPQLPADLQPHHDLARHWLDTLGALRALLAGGRSSALAGMLTTALELRHAREGENDYHQLAAVCERLDELATALRVPIPVGASWWKTVTGGIIEMMTWLDQTLHANGIEELLTEVVEAIAAARPGRPQAKYHDDTLIPAADLREVVRWSATGDSQHINQGYLQSVDGILARVDRQSLVLLVGQLRATLDGVDFARLLVELDTEFTAAANAEPMENASGGNFHGGSSAPKERPNPRDKFIYNRMRKGDSLKQIRSAVHSRKEWEDMDVIGTVQGISAAAKRYAKKFNKPWPPRVQR